MSGEEIFAQRKEVLLSVIRKSFGTNRHTDGFASRLLGSNRPDELLVKPASNFQQVSDELAYSGYPEVAHLGFEIGGESNVSIPSADRFLAGLQRLRNRGDDALDTLAADDVALLGIADGLARVNELKIDVADVRTWLVGIIDRYPPTKSWSFRARLLAGDLIDPRGRLMTPPDANNIDEMALEIVFRSIWVDCYRGYSLSSFETHSDLLKALLTGSPPQIGELDRAAVWYRALGVLVNASIGMLLPSVSETARLLSMIQGAFKRWTWKDQSRRQNTVPSRWLIDDEYDVQSLLWTVLFPLYGPALVDETYLPNWGFVQPRADLGIINLKLIIEVKIARVPSDFAEFEGQIGEDLGLYFKDINQFNRMIVFVYDDCDHPQPEKYGVFRNALLRRGCGFRPNRTP